MKSITIKSIATKPIAIKSIAIKRLLDKALTLKYFLNKSFNIISKVYTTILRLLKKSILQTLIDNTQSNYYKDNIKNKIERSRSNSSNTLISSSNKLNQSKSSQSRLNEFQN